MVILRATKKVLGRLAQTAADGASDTALGDWYVNRVVIDRQPLLILVSSTSLLPIVAPARNVRDLPATLPKLVADRLRRLKISEELIAQEMAAMSPVHVAPTRDRSVVGTLVSFGQELPFYLSRDGWDESHLPEAERKLSDTPCRVTGKRSEVVFPLDSAPALLQNKWRGQRGRLH